MKNFIRRFSGLIVGLGIMFMMIMVSSLLFSCATAKKVEREKIVRDTIIVRDSAHVIDTIVRVTIEKEFVETYMEKETTNDYIRGDYDSLRKAIVDTIYIRYKEISKMGSNKALSDTLRDISKNSSSTSVEKSHNDTDKESKSVVVEKKSLWDRFGKFFVILVILIAIGIDVWKSKK